MVVVVGLGREGMADRDRSLEGLFIERDAFKNDEEFINELIDVFQLSCPRKEDVFEDDWSDTCGTLVFDVSCCSSWVVV